MKTYCFIILFIAAYLGYSSNIQAQKSLSDDFENPSSLQNWQRFFQVEGWPDMMENILIKDGKLILEPYSCGWYADYHAPFLFKELKGDFTVSTRLKISGRKSSSPQATWSLAGLMVRAPRDIRKDTWKAKGENWLFLTTGVADKIEQPVFETKTTVNSRSKLQLHPNQLDWVVLKIVRRGAIFSLFYQYKGKDWVKIEEFNRPDLPDKLQVGVNAYTDFYAAEKELMRDVYKYNSTVIKYGNPDLKVSIDYIKFDK